MEHRPGGAAFHDGGPEHLVGPGNQGPGGPEVGGQRQGRQRQGFGAAAGQAVPGGHEQARLGLTPAIDGLLGVAHHHQGAPGARLPAGHQTAEQLHLVDAGVLEFVHQEVLEAPIQAEHDLGGVVLGEEIQGCGLKIDEIQGPLPGAELFIHAQGFSHQDDQVLERRGFFGRRPGGGQVPALLQSPDHRAGQVLDQGRPFFLVKALGEPVFSRESFAGVSLPW